MSELLTFIRFLVVGVGNTAIGLGAIYVCMYGLNLPDVPANAAGYVAGLLFGFTFNRRWTFRSDASAWPSLARYLAAFAMAYALNLAAVLAARDWLGLGSGLAQAMGVPAFTLAFFMLNRFVVFGRR